jgi:hypothetical protein
MNNKNTLMSDYSMYQELLEKKKNRKQEIAKQIGIAIFQTDMYRNQLQEIGNQIEYDEKHLIRLKNYLDKLKKDSTESAQTNHDKLLEFIDVLVKKYNKNLMEFAQNNQDDFLLFVNVVINHFKKNAKSPKIEEISINDHNIKVTLGTEVFCFKIAECSAAKLAECSAAGDTSNMNVFGVVIKNLDD